jgi:hypothetical protein
MLANTAFSFSTASPEQAIAFVHSAYRLLHLGRLSRALVAPPRPLPKSCEPKRLDDPPPLARLVADW